MREYVDTPQSIPQSAEDKQPYGEVALGVECAWPQSLPVLEPLEEQPA